MKRALIIFAGVIVLIGLGIGVYLYFFASKPTLTVGGTGNPFGDTGSGNAAQGAVTAPPGSAGVEVAPRLVRITANPVSDGTAVFDTLIPATDVATASTSASSTKPALQVDVSVRYIDRASGNVFNYLAHKRELVRLSNRTLPGIQKASWLSDGSVAYVQFLGKTGDTETTKAYALPANGQGGFFLEDGLSQVVGVGSSTLLSLLSSTNGSTATLAKFDGSNVRTLFNSLLSLLTITVSSNGTYFAYTKPAQTIPGYAFLINSNGTMTRILGAAGGLSILPSPSGKSVLYSYITNGALRLGVMDVATRATTPLPLATLSEKCVWASDSSAVYCAVPIALSGTLPDDWYQGAVSFTDRIWKIDLSGRVATLVVDPSTVSKSAIDAVDLAIDGNNDVLVFTDKTTGSLWAYDL